ncbi:MAG: hypothetical protein IJD26_01885 [Lachnospiraceae bacterium]|nr:hypothetical protein [Lachnospiraceae bacterium]
MEVIVTDKMMEDMSFSGDMGFVEGMEYMDGMMGETQQAPLADRLMGSWIFVGGVTAAVLVIGVLLGFLSAKRKIKKGIDLYED